MGTFEQYWHKAAAGINKALRPQADTRPRLQDLEREILALTTENHTLAGKLEQIRADIERRGSEELRQIKALEQALRETGSARIADSNRLTEQEQLLAEVIAGCKLEREQTRALEVTLAETIHRLETRNNQLKFLQDSAREQLQALRTSLAEASSRLETRDNELGLLQDSAHEQIVALEATLTETSSRFETTDKEINELRARFAEQIQQLETTLDSTTTRFEAMDNRFGALEKKLEIEHRLQENLFQDVQARLHNQDKRLKRVMLTAAFTLVLVAAVGAILFWGMR